MAADRPLNDTSRTIEFERFFDLAVDVFVVTGPDGRFAFVNQALARLLGVDRETILAGPWSTFVHPDDRERSAAEAAREFAEGHRTITFENRYVDVAGGEHWMDWNAELDPESGLVYGTARDVTEQKAGREALEEARAAAESANRAKSEFLSRMSHELRTPLNAVLGFAQLLELDDLTDQQRGYVDQILGGGQHLLDLIDEVLDISRIEIGEVSISVEPVDVAAIVADALSLLGPLADTRGVTIRSTVSHDQYVLADRQRLKQVLVNYVNNAIKYTPAGSTATIGIAAAGAGWQRISVADDGPGIPPELVARLFTPFERIGAEASAVEGTGLGLAHSRSLVERMGGRVGVDSTVGAGSTFWLELPIAEPSAEAPAADVFLPAGDSGAVVGTLLYVEDNPANLTLVEQIMAARPGIRLITAVRGSLGLDLAREHRPSLIALDLHLPDRSGEEVLAALRADAATSEIPVVIVSADATRPQIERLLAGGASAYLTKPIDVRRFLQVIDEHIGARSSPA